MKVAVIGASGNIGSVIAKELVGRGHAVTGIARDAGKIAPGSGVSPVAVDVGDTAALAAALAGHDAVVVAVPHRSTDLTALLDGIVRSGVPRYLHVGGAASLEVAPGKLLLDTPEFPDLYKPEATAAAAYLDKLRKVAEPDWTFLSPSAEIGPGERTGRFRLGDDRLLVDADGRSRISYADYAVALADELERPSHSRRRFTVGY
jgi:putative NADH-flavin reductase